MSNTIDNIGDQATLDGLISHTLTELEDDTVTSLRPHAFYSNDIIQKISLPSLNGSLSAESSFSNCINLESVNIGGLTRVGISAFLNCYKLKSLVAPYLTETNTGMFKNCRSLNEFNFSNIETITDTVFEHAGIGQIVLPKMLNNFGTYPFRGCRLSVLDLYNDAYNKSFKTNWFGAAYSLCHFIIRANSMVTLSNVGAFSNTPIYNGIGWIYVPSDLVDTYKTATNWSNFANQIVSISEYPKPLQNETISDSWSDILESVNNGTYSTKYNIGDIKYCNIGGTYVPMQIVAFDADELASGGTSSITFISLGSICLSTINLPSSSSISGWADCELREFLRNIIYPQIESVVRNAIKPVVKTYLYHNDTLSTTDTIWIPSMREINGATKESSGVYYQSVFTNSSSRRKYDGISQHTCAWWTRTNYQSSSSYFCANTSGSVINSISESNETTSVVIGFCI